ncbi:hypothetical protein NPIL_315211 [Nephila pilipes]|uniref:Uncharacterized protein n=1 Tax=Nephila pilipes TaxID=299642 RepID=A0A8X6MSW9_NEPPI|nr:hypothetical protein NPIL_315211 [Nephila pilipes]
MTNVTEAVAVPPDSGEIMDTGQLTQEDPSAKCARISKLQKQLECPEIRQIYLKSLINIEEREVQHAVTPSPNAKTLDAERKQLEKDMKLAAGELRSFFARFPNLLEVTYQMSQTSDDFEKLDIFYKGMCPSSNE